MVILSEDIFFEGIHGKPTSEDILFEGIRGVD